MALTSLFDDEIDFASRPAPNPFATAFAAAARAVAAWRAERRASEKHRLEIEKLKIEIERLKTPQ